MNQKRRLSKNGSSEALFTPRNLKSLESSRQLDYGRSQTSRNISKELNSRQTMSIQGRPTVKVNYKGKSNSFLKNIKNQLTTLKTQVDRIIKNDGEQQSYEDFGILKNVRQSNSQNHSESSQQESYDSQALWKHKIMMKKQHQQHPEQSNIIADLAQRKVKFLEQENQVLKSQVKKLRNKYRQYKHDAETQIMNLHQKLAQAENAISNNEEQLFHYKKQVQEQMMCIKKMLQQSDSHKKQNDNSISRSTNKSLQDENSSLRKSLIQLKQTLLQKQKTIIDDSNRFQFVKRENQKLKFQLERLNNQYETELENAVFKSGESHIVYEYSRSKIDQDDSKTMFQLEDALQRKDSQSRSAFKGGQSKYDDIKKQCEILSQQNGLLSKQAENMDKQMQLRYEVICGLKKEKEILVKRNTQLEERLHAFENNRPIQINDKDEYIKELQQKLQTLSIHHSSELHRIRQQLTPSEASPNQWINDDILRSQDLEIQSLKKQMYEKNDEIQKIRKTVGTLNIQLHNSRTELQMTMIKYSKQKKQFASELQITMSNLKSQIQIFSHVNNQLNQKITILNQDRNNKDQFIKQFITTKTESQQTKEEIQKMFEQYKFKFGNEYLRERIFGEAREVLELKRQLKEKDNK